MSTPPIFKLLQISLLFLFVQFGLPTLARAQTITLQGRVFFSTGEPASGVTVLMTKTLYEFFPPEITRESTVTDGSGTYSFTSEGRCAVSYDFVAATAEVVDDEPLPPSGTNTTSGCVLNDATIPDLQIARPQSIILGGIVSDETFRPVQGVTVTMTRTKYDLTPNVVTTDTTTTDEAGHYQFTVYFQMLDRRSL